MIEHHSTASNRKRIFLEYTSQCNAKPLCLHCQGAPFKYSARLEEKLLNEVIHLAEREKKQIVLTGGDPIVYPRVVKAIEKKGIKYTLMTNGLHAIKGIKPTKVIVSYDSVDIRPFTTTKILSNAISYDSPLTVTTCMSSGTNIIGIYETLKKEASNISHWRISLINESGNAINNKSLIPDVDSAFSELAKLLKIYMKEKEKSFKLSIKGCWYDAITQGTIEENKIKPNEYRSLVGNPCTSCSGQSTIAINAQGEVQYCPLSSEKIGVPSDIPSSYNSINFRNKFELKFQEWGECINCRYFLLCGGGCPAKAQESSGNWTGRDELYCQIFKSWERHILPLVDEETRDKLKSYINLEGLVYD